MRRFEAIGVLLCVPVLLAQSGDSALELGRASYRSNCGFCHGLDGRGGRGPDLVSKDLTHGDSDSDLRRVIQSGVPGSSMPAFRFEDDEVETLITYLKHMRGQGVVVQNASGDPVRGRAVYEKNACATCHQIGQKGSVFGPDLSRIGAARSLAYLRESIVNPTADIPLEYEGVTVVTKDGKRVQGVRINEDTFTIQLRDFSQKLHMFTKEKLRQVTHETKSLMPDYNKLPPSDIEDLLAYLVTLRGELRQGGSTKRVEGIR